MKLLVRNLFWMFLLSWLVVTGWGCDTTVENVITIPTEQDLYFRFNAGTGSTRAFSLKSDNTIDLTSVLKAQNFTKGAVVSTSIDTATLEVVFPSNERISFLSGAKLSFEATGASTTQVASQFQFPDGVNDDTVNMNIDATKDVASFVRADQFRGILDVTANTLQASKAYDLQVRLKLLVRVNF